MMLEGVDIKHTSLICVLSVSQVQGLRIRLHFDGYDSCYDFWRNAYSKEIYEVGYCKKNNLKLTPPLNFKEEKFEWKTYLSDKLAASEDCFIKSSDASSVKTKTISLLSINIYYFFNRM